MFDWLFGKRDRFCLVNTAGCMAHVRENERWGHIVKREKRDIIGQNNCQGVIVKFDDGKTEWMPDLWMHKTERGHFEIEI